MPGHIQSKNDRDTHFITFHQLCRLYQLDPRECINGQDHLGLRIDPDDTLYFPRYDGNYPFFKDKDRYGSAPRDQEEVPPTP